MSIQFLCPLSNPVIQLFFLLSWWSSLYILNSNFLPDTWLANSLSHSVGCLFFSSVFPLRFTEVLIFFFDVIQIYFFLLWLIRSNTSSQFYASSQRCFWEKRGAKVPSWLSWLVCLSFSACSHWAHPSRWGASPPSSHLPWQSSHMRETEIFLCISVLRKTSFYSFICCFIAVWLRFILMVATLVGLFVECGFFLCHMVRNLEKLIPYKTSEINQRATYSEESILGGVSASRVLTLFHKP